MFELYLILSAAVDLAAVYFCRLVSSPADLWKPLVLYPLVFISFLLLHLLAFILYSLTAKKTAEIKNIHNSHRRFMLCSLKLFFKLTRTHIHVRGEELVPNDKKFLFVCNHISVYDPMITMLALRKKDLAFVSKKENLEVPFAGRYILRSGCIALDREDNRQAVTAINAAANRITDSICAMGIYPEGGVNKSAKGLLPFKNGAFKIAKKAKVPVVVAVISNTRKINEHLLTRSKDIYLKILSVIPYEEIASLKTNEISDMVNKIMRKAVPEA